MYHKEAWLLKGAHYNSLQKFFFFKVFHVLLVTEINKCYSWKALFLPSS